MTSKHRAYLRSLANTMQPIVHVGKDGVNDNMIKQIWDALEARELIKGTVLQNAPVDAREAIEEICERTHAEPVQCIVNKFVIYRRASENPRIELP